MLAVHGCLGSCSISRIRFNISRLLDITGAFFIYNFGKR